MTTPGRRRVLRTRPRTTLRRPTTPAVSVAPRTEHPDHIPPQVPLHEALRRVMRDMPPVPKLGHNEDGGYYYQRLQDVIATLRTVCVTHGVIVLPVQVSKSKNLHGPLATTDVHTTFEITGPTGETRTVQYIGEARSETDKGTQLAMTQCWKYLMLRTFMIPLEGEEDADAFHPRLPRTSQNHKRRGHNPNPGPQNPNPQGHNPNARAQQTGERPGPQGTPTGARVPVQRTGSPSPVVTAPNAEVIADRLARAAAAASYEEVGKILAEAESSGAPRVEIEALRKLGNAKWEAEKKAAEKAKQDTPEAGEETGGEPTGAAPDAERPVPYVDAPAKTPESAAFETALAHFNECAELAGYTDPAAAARMFKAKYGKPLEEAELDEIEAFAAGMIPAGEPGGEDDPTSEGE